MAYTFPALSSDEIAWAALDLPFLSNNAMYASGVAGGWDAGVTTGTVASATEDEDNFEAKFGVDGNPDLLTKPNAASTLHTLVYDCSSSPITFDWFGVMNHNLYTLSCSSFQLQAADDAAFTSGLRALGTIDFTSGFSRDQRATVLSLFHTGSTPLRYTAVPYIRFTFICSSGVPEIGQIVLGQRRQQPYAPDNPFDRGNYQSLSAQAEAVAGTLTNNMRSLSRYRLNAVLHHDTDALQTEADEFWDDIEGGEQPFFWVETPNSDTSRFYMVHLDAPAFGYPYTQPNSRDWQIQATEQGHDTYFRDVNGI